MKLVIAAALIVATTIFLFGYIEGDLGAANSLKWSLPLLVFVTIVAGVVCLKDGE